MGRWIHRLDTINPDTLTANCANCGPVKVKRRRKPDGSPAYSCTNREAVDRQNFNDSKRKSPLPPPGTPRKRGRPRKLPHERDPKLHWLSSEERAEFLKDKVCSICGTKEKLRVDHCHSTGKLRGALCHNHNVGIGFFKENVADLAQAIIYLQEHART